MEVQFITTRPFPGWDAFRAALHQVDPATAIGTVQYFTKYVAERDDGVFRGVPPVFPITLHVVLREWVAALPTGSLPVQDVSARDKVLPVILQACREVNGLRESHPALSRSPLLLPSGLRNEERLRVLWFHHLEQQGLNWTPKLELGRSQRMFNEIWGRLHNEGKIRLRGKESTAFMASSYSLLLSLAVWCSNGVVPDVRQLMASTDLTENTLRTLLEAVAVEADEVQATFATSPFYPGTVQNYFQRYPLIRVGDWSLFAPLPDLLLQSWDLRNLFDGLECAVANLGDTGDVEYYRALGVVFEEYVQDLLREIADVTGSTFVEPFEYERGRESPDGFLVAPEARTLVFEAKCYRVPQRSYERMEFDEFERWFAALLGKNERERAPLRQGAAFFQSWQGGNAEALNRLGPDAQDAIYLIVSYEDVPGFASWRVFRRWYEQQKLERTLGDLWSRTVVISARDLEKLVAAVRVPDNAAPDLAELLSQYLRYREEAPDAHEVWGFKDNLGGWLMQTIPAIRDAEPQTVADARERLFQRALGLGFGEDTPQPV